MADNQGMFGQDPALLQQAIQQQNQARYDQQGQRSLSSAIGSLGAQAGGMLGQGISSAFGYEDPRMAEAKQMQKAQNDVLMEARAMGIDPAQDPSGYGKLLAKKYVEMGKPDKATVVMQQVQSMEAKKAEMGLVQAKTAAELKKAQTESSPFGKIDPSKYSPESIRAFIQSGNQGDLRAIPDEKTGGSSQERMIEQLIQTRMPNATEQEKAIARAELHSQILSQPRMGMDPNSGQLYQTAGVKIPSQLQGQPQQGGIPPVNTLPPVSQGRKPVDISDREKLLEGRAQLDLLAPAMEKFNPSYAGYKSKTIADAALEGGRRGIIPSQEAPAQWWESYNQWVTGLMKSTFGASLTENEKKQITTFTASPAQSPKVVSDNIKKQMSVIENSMISRANALSSSGYNPEETTSILKAKSPVDVSGLDKRQAAAAIENSDLSIAEKIKALTLLKGQK